MEEPSSPDVMIREPAPPELGRALYLFRNVRLRPNARLLVAVRSWPVERFVAAAAWWPEANVGCFQLVGQPETLRGEVCERLINQVSENARVSGINVLQYRESVPDSSAWVGILERNGFKQLRSERFFEISCLQAWTRTMASFGQYKTRIPAGWRTESIRHHVPETILDLIEPFRLMQASELHHNWREDSVHGFELELSSILFNATRPIGALLTRRVQDALCVDIRVVRVENKLLSALGNILLFYHMAARQKPGGAISRLQFRGGATEHRETANLAMRMGGLELPSRHIFSKSL